MGEIAERMVSGELCQECGVYLGEPVGYPRTCEECGGDTPLHPAYDEEL